MHNRHFPNLESKKDASTASFLAAMEINAYRRGLLGLLSGQLGVLQILHIFHAGQLWLILAVKSNDRVQVTLGQ